MSRQPRTSLTAPSSASQADAAKRSVAQAWTCALVSEPACHCTRIEATSVLNIVWLIQSSGAMRDGNTRIERNVLVAYPEADGRDRQLVADRCRAPSCPGAKLCSIRFDTHGGLGHLRVVFATIPRFEKCHVVARLHFNGKHIFRISTVPSDQAETQAAPFNFERGYFDSFKRNRSQSSKEDERRGLLRGDIKLPTRPERFDLGADEFARRIEQVECVELSTGVPVDRRLEWSCQKKLSPVSSSADMRRVVIVMIDCYPGRRFCIHADNDTGMPPSGNTRSWPTVPLGPNEVAPHQKGSPGAPPWQSGQRRWKTSVPFAPYSEPQLVRIQSMRYETCP
jgi:hypothetical protein